MSSTDKLVSLESSDDFHVYGGVPVKVAYAGCGGEFCAGYPAESGDPPLCPACRRGDVCTAVEYRPDDAPRIVESFLRGQDVRVK